MYIKQDMDFSDLMKNCWSGAVDTLKMIEKHGKEEELMAHLEEIFETYFDNVPTMTEVNDYLWFDWEIIFETLGISEEESEEEEEKGEETEGCESLLCFECSSIFSGNVTEFEIQHTAKADGVKNIGFTILNYLLEVDTMRTMKQTTSTTWRKMMEIPTKAKTAQGIIKAIKRHTDFFNDYTQEEMEKYVDSEWVEICSNGVIIWED